MIVFFDYQNSIWENIRTTRITGISSRKVRRRVRPMSCFENGGICSGIIFGVICYIYNLNKSWKNKQIKEFAQKT